MAGERSPTRPHPTFPEYMGRRIKAVREAKELTQADLASALALAGLPIQRGSVGMLEGGQRALDLEELLILAEVLNVSVMDLIGDRQSLVAIGYNRKQGTWTSRRLNDLQARLVYSGEWLDNVKLPDVDESESNLSLSPFRAFDPDEPDFAGLTMHQAEAAEAASYNDADRAAARRLGVGPRRLVRAAFRLWGHSLTDERDRRLAAEEPIGADQRQIQAIRGHITRDLLREIGPELQGEL